MGSNPSEFRGDPGLPVDAVSREDAQSFCARASKLAGRPIRLPSEAEWEYACRGGTTTECFFGDDDHTADRYAWFDLNSRGRTHPVGPKRPNPLGLRNPLGLHDIVGNVWEWCEDVWHGDYDVGAPVDGSAWLDDGEEQPRRVLRGGAYDMDAFRCRSAYRSYDWKTLATSRFGLRIAISL